MRFIFYTDIYFENWDYDSSVKRGIGGSETSIVEMSWRLARRGHEVIVYAPIKKTTKSPWRNVVWKHYKKANFKEKGIWILYRCPERVDSFIPRRKDQTVWLLWQDWDYPTLTKKRADRVDREITLCKAHGHYMMDNHPVTSDKLWLSSNGIKLDLIEKVEKRVIKKGIKRNPHRIMYASSPDRGLKQALLVFKKAREYVPDLEFYSFYGFNNINKILKGKFIPKDHFLVKSKAELLELMKQDGVHFMGRIPQPKLMEEWFKSGIYLYITDFFETSHISGQEAQACGAVPVFSPVFAQAENIKWGIAVQGKSTDPLTIARAAAQVVRLCDPALQAQYRPGMMEWARKRFNWEVFVTQWIAEAEGKREEFEKEYEFPQQLEFTTEEIKQKVFKHISSDFNFTRKPYEKVVQEFADVKGKSVLDAGGYDGRQAKWALDQGATSAVVVDNLSWKIYKDWPKFKPLKGVKYLNEDIFNYTKKADVVICQNVIYHVRNPWLLVERLRNLTKEELILSTSYISGDNQSWKVYRPYEGHPVSWTVAWRPTIKGLIALLEANGFKVTRESHSKGHVVVKCIPIKPPIGFNYDKKL